MHLKSFVRRNLAEGALIFAGAIVLIVQFAAEKHFLSDGGTDHTHIIGVPLDDVYIHCRYAENLLSGNGYSFNPGHTVSADTSPLWVVMIAIGGLITSHLDLIAVLLSSLFYLLLAPAVFRICRETFLLSYSWSVAAGMLTLLSSRLVWASASGMEVTLACFLVLVIVHEHIGQRQYGGSMRMREGLFLALGIGARPELMFLAVVILSDWLIVAKREKKGFINLLIGSVVFLVFVSPVYAIPLYDRGSLIYHSAVVQGARISFIPDMGYLWFALKVLLASFSIPILFAFIAPFLLRKHKGVVLLGIFGFGLPILLAFIAPQFRHHGRYFFPVFPVLIIVGIVVLAKLFTTASRKKNVIAVHSILVSVALIGAGRGILLSSESVANINDQHLAVAEWVKTSVTESDRIAADDVGAIGYFTKRQLIDITGLISHEFFPLQHNQQLVWNEARKQGANLFIIYTRLNPAFYEFAKDSLELLKEFRVRLPLVASADTVMSVFRVRGDSHAAR